MRSRKVNTLAVFAVAALVGCGQEPAFKNLQSQDSTKNGSTDTGGSGSKVDEAGNPIANDGASPDGSKSADAKNPNDPIAGNENNGSNPSNNKPNPNGSNPATPGGNTPSNPGNNGGGITFPDIDKDSDKDDLMKCLASWGSTPFAGPTSVRKIYASVVIGGFGNGINDTTQSVNPELVIVYAGVNVGGNVTYNMMNKNAYYCMVSNVNVATKLTVNLHCNARLSDSKVQVDIGSQQNGNTAAVGVNVGSEVTVQNIRPNGEQCIR